MYRSSISRFPKFSRFVEIGKLFLQTHVSRLQALG